MDRPQLPSTLAWLDGRDLIATVAWHDPDVTGGFACTDTYVETYWLPFLGPSATWALRRIAGWLASAPDSGLWLPVEPLARSLGLGAPVGRNSPARRTIARLVDFRLAYVDHDHDLLAVRTLIPQLSDRAIDRLPGHLLVQHRTDYPAHGGAVEVAEAPSPVSA
jgi:hypothetical protein